MRESPLDPPLMFGLYHNRKTGEKHGWGIMGMGLL